MQPPKFDPSTSPVCQACDDPPWSCYYCRGPAPAEPRQRLAREHVEWLLIAAMALDASLPSLAARVRAALAALGEDNHV